MYRWRPVVILCYRGLIWHWLLHLQAQRNRWGRPCGSEIDLTVFAILFNHCDTAGLSIRSVDIRRAAHDDEQLVLGTIHIVSRHGARSRSRTSVVNICAPRLHARKAPMKIKHNASVSQQPTINNMGRRRSVREVPRTSDTWLAYRTRLRFNQMWQQKWWSRLDLWGLSAVTL